jgi:hypothetical protein
MPLNTDIDEHLHNFSLRKPYHRVAPSLLWGCSKDVPSFYQHSEWDERKTENINIIKGFASTSSGPAHSCSHVVRTKKEISNLRLLVSC